MQPELNATTQGMIVTRRTHGLQRWCSLHRAVGTRKSSPCKKTCNSGCQQPAGRQVSPLTRLHAQQLERAAAEAGAVARQVAADGVHNCLHTGGTYVR